MEGLAHMFTNLDLRQFTWKREPVLYVTLAIMVLQVVSSALQGDLAWVDAVESIVLLVFGFVARGEVKPFRP
jgi:hypothetical protein